MIEKIVARMAAETDDYAAGRTTVEPTLDVLAISGGSDKGAFGAAFLAAWGTVPPGPLARPNFDIVTGVSTGALIAPFVFTDDCTACGKVAEIYQNPRDDWISLNGLFFLFQDAVFDPTGLLRDLRRVIGPEMIASIARESAKGRLLAVGSTNMDVGVSHTWDLGEEAVRAETTGDPARVYKILQASSAVPGLFPPVEIDGHMHVDGGASSNILVVGDLLAPDSPRRIFQARYPDRKLPRIRYWVILNYQIAPTAKLPPTHWLAITSKGVETLIRSSTITAVRYFAQQIDYIRVTEHADIELRYVSIPDDWRPVEEGMFQKPNMRSLANVGLKLGADPSSWRTDLSSSPIPLADDPPAK